MDIDNLYKVMKLYLDKEDNGAAILTITKYSDVVDFSFSMTNYPEDLTIVSVNKANVDVDLLINVIRGFKGDLLVIDDKYDFNKEKNICKYESIFNTGREIIFKNFKLEEVNLLRNVIYNISKGISVTRKSNLKTEMMIWTLKYRFWRFVMILIKPYPLRICKRKDIYNRLAMM